MRVSVFESDPGWAWHRPYKVFLDGHECKRALTADEELGIVVVSVVDGSGNLVLDGDEVRRETLHGDVRIEEIVP